MATIKNYAGLEYVYLKTNKSSISIKDALDIDLKIALEIVKARPLRGKEILFLRKQLKASCANISLMLNGTFDASTISKWEKKDITRLSPSNEMFMRVFFAEKFNINVKATSKDLVPEENKERLELAA
jgi:DNA-binding transcriptional regulator YiaG